MKKLAILLVIAIGAMPASAQKVKVSADPKVDVSKYKTYAWDEGRPTPNPVINQLIIEAIDQVMSAKGLTRVNANPDITIVALGAVDSELHIAYPSWSNAMGTAPSTGIAAATQRWPVSTGTLVVDIADAVTRNNVWRGVATDTLSHGPASDPAKDARNAEKHVKKSVEKMFKQYPRPSGSRGGSREPS